MNANDQIENLKIHRSSYFYPFPDLCFNYYEQIVSESGSFEKWVKNLDLTDEAKIHVLSDMVRRLLETKYINDRTLNDKGKQTALDFMKSDLEETKKTIRWQKCIRFDELLNEGHPKQDVLELLKLEFGGQSTSSIAKEIERFRKNKS